MHKTQWQDFQRMVAHQRMPQAILLTGGQECALEQIIRRLIALNVCKNKSDEPCLQCHHCLLIQDNQHPDVHWIRPEKAGRSLKIEQIRHLQTQAYKTPQSAGMQFFVLYAVEHMNKSVSNALLKILEEPSEFTHFILVAEHLSTVLPTLISRCQRWHFNVDLPEGHFLDLIARFPEGSALQEINQNSTSIFEALINLSAKNTLPTVVASQLKDFEFKDLLHYLYLIFGEIIKLKTQEKQSLGPHCTHLNALMSTLELDNLFNQLSKITSLQRKISHNLNVNQTLALEDLFINLTARL